MPYTLPSAAIALARNSGCAQLTTTLVFASTELTIPTSPSGLTTADKGFTPWFFPADTMKLRALDGSGSCSTSAGTRSEEHTSELQSRFDLVCRLLLEKKKKRKRSDTLATLRKKY